MYAQQIPSRFNADDLTHCRCVLRITSIYCEDCNKRLGSDSELKLCGDENQGSKCPNYETEYEEYYERKIA